LATSFITGTLSAMPENFGKYGKNTCKKALFLEINRS
jgi:hypothetical protein